MFIVIAVNVMVIAVVVIVHYEFLYRLTVVMPSLKVRHRFRIVFGVFGALAAHALEIWVFALSYFWMHHAQGWGHFEGNFQGTLLDCAYFSFTTYTTLGFGDIAPHGEVRYLVGLEALTGFVLITWTASFLYLEMTRYWGKD